MKKLVSSGELQRMFLAEDKKTIIRRPNCRKFCLDNKIYMEIHDKAWLIDFKSFMEKSTRNELESITNFLKCGT